LASFQRQLNLYGFRRISEGKEKGGYFHKDFFKGKRSLARKIRRKSSASRSTAPAFFQRLSAASAAGPAPSSQFPASFYGGSTLPGLGQYQSNASTKDLLLATLANNSRGLYNNPASDAGSLVDMPRQIFLASQQNGANNISHQDLLRNAAASFLWANQNGNNPSY
jgi:hypothetical protein